MDENIHAKSTEATNLFRCHTLLSLGFGFLRRSTSCVLQSCTSRCVRRAFLCGDDPYTGISYEHRRKTIEDRILLLGTIFCIDVCAYAVMSNHHHLVLHINKAESMKLSDIEVCTRWHKLFKGTVLTQKFEHNKTLDEVERKAVQIKLDEWRLQLTSISWFMRTLNEPIARQANKDDNVTGCFWDKFLLLQNLHFLHPCRSRAF